MQCIAVAGRPPPARGQALLAVTREFLCPAVSRSGLDRCLRRHGVGNLRALQPAPDKPAPKAFKTYEPGFVHVDVKYLPQMADEARRRYLFVAIDRATRSGFVSLKADKTARSARAFLKALAKAAPFRIQTLLTDNGTEFTDRLFGSRAGADRGACVRAAVPGAGHRAPPDARAPPADQWHGGALQRTHRRPRIKSGAGSAAHAPLPVQ